ncbi:structural maintenance of chromosomes protein 4 [Anopheles ziemanni]|uniref:structural maintenance of chromosomes protein 4 n=1 Tax=Anopheles coustani TaxID=139045 RepID=UPI002658126F|nr:structural maintenance of chromosomes protein 4 [Anopheles coustani]XP_058177279.1 structural maintenance of chromosomes protein 4 [Anopheles ziemanni]
MNSAKKARPGRPGGVPKKAPHQEQQQQPMDADVDDDACLSEDEEGGTRIGGIYIPPPVPPYCSTECKGPRLIIECISNYNFKSYAGHVMLGPFHQRFSAIIGPNGSGKSNVIDSMLFVFGYRAQKIRSKKLSVLLHNSSKHPNTNSCTVGVHFKQIIDKEDGTFDEVPNSGFVVARTAFRDNSSYYTIDNKRVHFKEVSKLLKHHGIDLDHNRFLILQGEVESIAMMKSKAQTENECGLLEYLEDIVGTTRYKQPLLKINERVEALNEERTEKHNRCKLAEREMKDLEKPMEEAVEFLRQENTLTRTKNQQIQKYISEQKRKIGEFEVERDQAAGLLAKHDETYDAIKTERVEKEKLVREEIKQYDALVASKEAKEMALKNSLDKYAKVQANMRNTNERRKKTLVQIEKEKEKLKDLLTVPVKNQNEIEESEKKIESLTKQKTEVEATLTANLETLKDETKVLLEEKEKLQTELIELTRAVDESKSALALAESELKICQSSEVSEQRKLQSLRYSFEDSQKTLEEKRARLQTLEEALPIGKAELEAAQQKLVENGNEEKELRQQLRVVQGKLQEATSVMQSTRSHGKVLDALMRQKNEGRIPGILGRLGNLGGIDARYDVAISTCCGYLDHIVVETVNTAQACIDFLKQHDIGRASFIALEKIQQYRQYCRNTIQTPENVPRLFDLIRVEDERVLPAFYFALRDTLVAENLDQGQRIAYGRQRFRVVTVGGDVIETSGTMSGGGRSQQRGRMGTQVQTKTSASEPAGVSSREIEQLQIRAQDIQSQINYLQEQQGELETNIQQLTAKVKGLEMELKRMRMDVKSLQEQMPRLKEQLDYQEERVARTHSDPEKVRALEAKVAECTKAHKSSSAKADKLQAEVDRYTEQINEITNSKVKVLQTKIANFGKQIDKLAANISKLTVEIKTSERNVKKSEDKIKSMEEEVEAAKQSIREGNDERSQLEEEANQLKVDLEEVKVAIEKAHEGSSSIKKEIVALQKREAEGKMKRLEFEQILQTIEAKLQETKDTLPHWRDKLKPLKLHEIPGESAPEPLKEYSEEELSSYKLPDLQYQISILEEKLNSNKPNLSVIDEFLKKQEAYLSRVKVLEEITAKRNEMRQLHDDVRKKRFNEFMLGFHIITKKLKEMYQMITLGGDAELELVDSMDPFNEGIVFSVRPPKKSWKMISNLSGGEKTLSSLALVFALHYYKPSPLYVMDEIDAALDFKNVSIVAHYIKERTKNAQFIIISLRSNMFELSDYLVGIYKVSDCTNSVTIGNDPPKFESHIGASQQPTQQFGYNDQSINLHEESVAASVEDTEKSTAASEGAQSPSVLNGDVEKEAVAGNNSDDTVESAVQESSPDVRQAEPMEVDEGVQ